jgi:hypothetical protein
LGFRIPCLIGILGFNTEIIIETDISPMFNDTDSLIRDRRAPLKDRQRYWGPSGDTHLWDAIDHTRGKLLSAKAAGRYPRANCQIVVFADGNDIGPAQNPATLCAQLKTNLIVIDSVAVSLCAKEASPSLAQLSHATGGFAFRPANGALGMRIFEKEPFLSVPRRPGIDIRGTPFDAAPPYSTARRSAITRNCRHARSSSAPWSLPDSSSRRTRRTGPSAWAANSGSCGNCAAFFARGGLT